MLAIAAIGLGAWAAGTIAIRAFGSSLLDAARQARMMILYTASFAAMLLLVPALLAALGIERALWFQAATLLIFPTLVLDAFSSLWFRRVFPRIDASAAGAFGGWMLISCAGAVAGVWLLR